MTEKPKFEKQERLSWDEFFMEIALTASKRVACLYYKVASVFVDENHKIISIGYNGPPTGDRHCNEIGCAKVHGDPVTGEMRRCRGAHSEINAIINSGDTTRLKNSTLYVTTFPCYDCMKALANLGVKRIVYYTEYLRILDGTDGAKKVAEMEAWELAGRKNIKLEKYHDIIETKDAPLEQKVEKMAPEKKDRPRW